MPLEHAAASGDFDLVDRLIKAGANGSSGWKGCRRRTLLDAATFGGNVNVVSALLQAGCGPDVNKVPSSSKRSALYQSIVGKHESVARCLIIAGADVNYEDPTDRCTPLYAAAVTARQDGLVRDLLIAGACPNARAGYRRRTPLHGAAELGLDRIVSVLLGTPSTDKDTLDDRGYSPLMLASRHGDVTTVDNLLHAGADLTLRNHLFHNSALDMAAQEGYVGVMKALLDHGADLSAAGGAWSALHNAALMDEVDSVRVLLDAGADLNCKDSESGETPLHVAAKHSSDAALLVLLRRGADPNEKTSDGDAALHLTASGDGRHIDKTVDLLLRWGASEQALGGEGKTTAQLLQRLKHEGEGEWEMDELEPALELLASAPADRTWRRRCWLVMLRARADRDRMNRRSNRLRSQGEVLVAKMAMVVGGLRTTRR